MQIETTQSGHRAPVRVAVVKTVKEARMWERRWLPGVRKVNGCFPVETKTSMSWKGGDPEAEGDTFFFSGYSLW